MTVAVTRTKAEQAFAESFEAVAAKLPGGRAVAEARKAAIGAFAGLGLPHRRIEEWKYTDLRSALKEALPPAIADATPVTGQEIDAALEGLAALDAHRVVFVNGAYRPELSTGGTAKGLEIGPLASALGRSGERGTGHSRAPGQEAVVALNTAFMTDGAVVRIAQGREARQAGAAGVRPRRQRAAPRHHAQQSQDRRRRAGHGHRGPRRAAGRAAGQANTLSEVTVGDGASADAPQVHAGRHRRRPISPAGWRRSARRRSYRAFQLTAGDRPGAQHTVRHLQRRGRQARHLRLLPRPRHRAHRHHAGGRSRRARLREPRAVQGRAGRTGRAASSRAR